MKKAIFAFFVVAAVLSSCNSSAPESTVPANDSTVVKTDSVAVVDTTAVVADTTQK